MSNWLETYNKTVRKRKLEIDQSQQPISGTRWDAYEESSYGTTPVWPPSIGRAPLASIRKSDNILSMTKTTTISKSGSTGSSDSSLSPSLIAALKQHVQTSKALPITKKLPPEETHSSLNAEQRLVIESILSGYNVFFTGPAGSGKSHILATLQRLLAKTRRVVVTATTGIAACSVGGVTIHSFAGCGMGIDAKSRKPVNQQITDICGKVMGNVTASKRWRETDVLVVDEVSMMSSGFLDMLNTISQRTRGNRQPFGGMQIVLVGDFFQLPPVEAKSKSSNISPSQRQGTPVVNGFAFEAECWCQVIQKSVLLTQVFRQGGDAVLLKILNEARIGELSESSVSTLKRHALIPRASRIQGPTAIKPTLLECRNAQVDHANSIEMKLLNGEERTFIAQDMALHAGFEAQLRQCAAPETLILKEGAQVILLKNLDPTKGLVNGSRGVVVGFQTSKQNLQSELPRNLRQVEFPLVVFESVRGSQSNNELRIVVVPEEWSSRMGDVVVCSRVQVPLRLAWALSVHKSQGMTIPHLSISLKGVFEYGQAYVALSRGTSLDTLTLKGFDPRAFTAHPRVKAFYQLLEEKEIQDLTASQAKSASLISTQRQTVSATKSNSQHPVPLSDQTKAASLKSTPWQAGYLKGNAAPQMNFQQLASIAPHSNTPSIQLNAAQKQRMEENRKKALAQREAKFQQHQQQQQSASNTLAGYYNPYLKRK